MNDRSRETNRAAQQAEAGFVLLAALVVLAILGICLILTDISIIGGVVFTVPLPLLMLKRFTDRKKRIRLRKDQVRAHNEGKNLD